MAIIEVESNGHIVQSISINAEGEPFTKCSSYPCTSFDLGVEIILHDVLQVAAKP
jgi:hypothetical protein